jgi:hypothetical protein
MFITGRDIARVSQQDACVTLRVCDGSRQTVGFFPVPFRPVGYYTEIEYTMSLPPHVPVVLITSAPPGSSSQKRKSREEPSNALKTAPDDRTPGNQRAAQRTRKV